MNDVKYLGWFRYTDTGRPYRRWKFLKDVPEVEALAGDILHDRGPGEGSFWLLGSDGGAKGFPEEEAVFDWMPSSDGAIGVHHASLRRRS